MEQHAPDLAISFNGRISLSPMRMAGPAVSFSIGAILRIWRRRPAVPAAGRRWTLVGNIDVAGGVGRISPSVSFAPASRRRSAVSPGRERHSGEVRRLCGVMNRACRKTVIGGVEYNVDIAAFPWVVQQVVRTGLGKRRTAPLVRRYSQTRRQAWWRLPAGAIQPVFRRPSSVADSTRRQNCRDHPAGGGGTTSLMHPSAS